MFELSVACKYLIPRRRQLSVSIISLLSILVIALVVWLIVVFFSVTDGLEKSWVQKLTAMTAPVRITPTDAYYHSYYHQIDSISESSNYSSKTIREKLESDISDPYNPTLDEEIPGHWPYPDLQADGSLKDLVKLVYTSLDDIRDVPGLQGQDFEFTATHIRLNLLRNTNVLHAHNIYGSSSQSSLSYPAYLGFFEENNANLGNTLLPIETVDINNLLYLTGFASRLSTEESPDYKIPFSADLVQSRLENFFNSTTITQLKARSSGWTIPRILFPPEAVWEACAILKEQQVMRLLIPKQRSLCTSLQQELEEQGLTVVAGKLHITNDFLSFISNEKKYALPDRPVLTLAGGSDFPATFVPASLTKAKQIDDIRFSVQIPIQGTTLAGEIPYKGLEIAKAEPHMEIKQTKEKIDPRLWVFQSNHADGSISYVLPKDPQVGEGILLPKSFRDAGVLIGDRGSLSYLSPTASVLQEQQIGIYVAGFYDPGIIPIGGKFILASPETTSLIRSSHQQEDKLTQTAGINVRFNQLDKAQHVKEKLLQALKKQGVSRYWNVETYREYEFTKGIMQELQSQKNLFMLIAIVIIIVACSNIISMLIILVNDKKNEIGILRSMGASSLNIALIFGTAGALIGVLGSVIGILSAILTLHHLDTLIGFLSRLQGHDMFNATLYGQILPHELSVEALSFVLFATICISLVAGIVPAIKACLLRPSEILRSSGG